EKLEELKCAAKETNPKRASSLWPTGTAVTLFHPEAFKTASSKFEKENLMEHARVSDPGTCPMLDQ
ncbi:unnamed protein product, partial [Prorocentrum cordatum]